MQLIIFPNASNPRLINFSPFAVKAMTFIKLAKIECEIKEFSGSPAKFPTKKLPVLQDGEKFIPDSSLIQVYLSQKFNIDLNAHLSASEHAQGYAFAKLCEEYLYFIILHERWLIDQNFEKLRAMFFAKMPALLRKFVSGMLRNSIRKSALGQGVSRHSDEQVMAFGQQCIQSISDFLADKPFLMGEKVSTFDSTVYAFVSSLLHSDLNPVLKAQIQQYPNLIAYDERLYSLCFA